VNYANLNTGSYLSIVPEMKKKIFPKRGGFSYSLRTIRVMMEILTEESYKLHTVEINNPDTCNVNKMSLQRRGIFQESLDNQVMLSLNNFTFVDVDYYKQFFNVTNQGDDPTYFDIQFQSTRNSENIHLCELRAFVEKTN
jgi:hypothetical protein